MSIAEREKVFSRINEHDGYECTHDGFSFGWSEEQVIESVVAAGGKDKQVVLKITLPFGGFANEFERVFACQHDFVGDIFPRALRHSFDVRDDAVDVLPCMRTIVIGLQQDDMCAGFAGDIRADLGVLGLFLQHRYRH